jgi:hypothetical protein
MAMKKTIFFLILICLTGMAKADWPVGKKRLMITPSFSYFYTSRVFDSTGRIKASPNNDQFISKTLGIYGLAGLSRRLDLIFNIPISNITAKNIYVKESKTGVGDAMFGFAYHTPSNNLKSFFTMKALVILPVYSNVSAPYMGYGSKGARVAANYSFSPRKRSFAVIEGGYARYFDEKDGPNQYSLDLTYGKELANGFLLSFSYSHLSSVSDNKAFSTNLNINKDYMYGKISCAFGKKISRTITPYIQTFYTLYGRNAGQGFGGSVFVALKIP